MTNTIRVPSASSPPTTDSGLADAVRQPSPPVVQAGFVDIETLVAELEQDPAMKAAIADGRAKLAEHAYSDEGPRRLAFYRLRKGWSQKELAQRMRTSQSYIARLETGGIDPQFGTVLRLAEVLEISLADLATAMKLREATP